MASNNILERIERFNRGRESERLAIKYARMRSDAFTFLRGTAHLFYEDWPRRSPLNSAPKAWICGDLHLENFGGYTAADGREYFDVCDFDEAALAPVTWELVRLCVSLLLVGEFVGLKKPAAELLIRRCLDAYAAAWMKRSLALVDRRVAQPDLRKFLSGLSSVHPDAFLAQRTRGKGGTRRLRMLNGKTLPASAGEAKRIRRWWKKQARNRNFARLGDLLDVARRITGTGSLGVHRYALLADNGRQPRLLDLKEAVPASMIQQHLVPANPWANEAERVIAVEQHAEVARRRLLASTKIGKRHYLLRRLNPGDDKLTVGKGDGQRLMRLAPRLGRVAAASHRRSAGWKGAASANKVATYVRRKAWRAEVVDYALAYKKTVERDWRAFRKATRRRL